MRRGTDSGRSPASEGNRSRHKGAIKPARILVVEDQELLATVLANVLGDAHEVICAPNVEDAVEYLLNGGIDLVLLDCVLPDGPDWQVASKPTGRTFPLCS